MYTKRVFSARDMARWTRFETSLFLAYVLFWTALYFFLELHWVEIPWTPLALVGTAVAFVIGFQNNSAYGRIWEARKIWGAIVNSSRTFGLYTQDFIDNAEAADPLPEAALAEERRKLIHRHVAWLTALRYAMRSPKPWETIYKERTNQEWQQMVPVPEQQQSLEEALAPYLSAEELAEIQNKGNKPTALLYLQSRHLRQLKERGHIWPFSFLQFEKLLKELFTHQGKSERIKNFPYPRHFATLNHYFMWLFVLLIPLALIPQFGLIGLEMAETQPLIGRWFVWLAVPFYVAVAWTFHTMERIGRTGENPFEGLANDIPISTIARGIEIDLRQNLGEAAEQIPDPIPVHYDTQM